MAFKNIDHRRQLSRRKLRGWLGRHLRPVPLI